MSDSESDDDFLSADEGDDDVNTQISAQECVQEALPEQRYEEKHLGNKVEKDKKSAEETEKQSSKVDDTHVSDKATDLPQKKESKKKESSESPKDLSSQKTLSNTEDTESVENGDTIGSKENSSVSIDNEKNELLLACSQEDEDEDLIDNNQQSTGHETIEDEEHTDSKIAESKNTSQLKQSSDDTESAKFTSNVEAENGTVKESEDIRVKESIKDDTKDDGTNNTKDKLNDGSKGDTKGDTKDNDIMEGSKEYAKDDAMINDSKDGVNDDIKNNITDNTDVDTSNDNKHDKTIVRPESEKLNDTSNHNAKTESNVSPSSRTENESKSSPYIENRIGSTVTAKEDTQIADGNTEDSSNSWGWDSWADDFISGAATKVSSLLETVEGQLGIPDPAEMAKTVKNESESREKAKEIAVEEKEKTHNEQPSVVSSSQSEGVSSWFSSFVPVASLTNIVQPLGQDLVSGGIDALEFLGKKTVSMISDGDPGLREKRKHMFEKQTLSSVLKEAKETSNVQKSSCKEEEKLTFSDLFDKFQGVAHLDGLEMISNECNDKLQRILKLQPDDVKKDTLQEMEAIKEKFDIDDSKIEDTYSEDFRKDIFTLSKKLKVKVTCSKLLNTWAKLKDKTDEDGDLFQNSISVLAEFLSRCIEFHRKVGDMLIVTDISAKDMSFTRAENLKLITEAFHIQLSQFTKSFVDKLLTDDEESSAVITDLYYECSNCQSILTDSHNLLLPIIQCSAIK